MFPFSRRRRFGAVIGLAALICCGEAGAILAQGIDAKAALANPDVQAAVAACRSDHARLCPNVIPGGGRIVKCLADQAQALSPGCTSAMLGARTSLEKAGIALPSPTR